MQPLEYFDLKLVPVAAVIFVVVRYYFACSRKEFANKSTVAPWRMADHAICSPKSVINLSL